MSAGTMMACSANEIIMGRQSSLGPIDPQLGGIPALNIIQEFEHAKSALTTGNGTVDYWKILLGKYPPAIVYDCYNAINLSEELVTNWLTTGMFENSGDCSDKVTKIVGWLNQNKESKNHGRHFDKEQCKRHGLLIKDLEADNELQDRILSIHHAYMITLTNTNAVKIIENNLGKAFIVNQTPTN